jgi:hypothetical protein
MPAWMTSAFPKMKKWGLIAWSIVATVAAAAAWIVGFTNNFFDLKQSNVSVEITGIEQVTSTAVDISASPDFKSLRKFFSYQLLPGDNRKYTYDDMRQEIDRQKQNLADRQNELAKLRVKVQDRGLHTPPADAPKDKKNPLDIFPPSIEFLDPDEADLSDARLPKYLEDQEKYLHDKEAYINAAETEVANYKIKAERFDAKIVVTAAISNPGDGATTLKPQALLRTDLGQGNYLDISLKIANYGRGVSEIKPRGTSVLTFESPSISRMSPEDQERFLNFFKNTSPTNLFIADVQGKYYKSNTIPFAQGIYEQKIYDGLKAYASEHSRK